MSCIEPNMHLPTEELPYIDDIISAQDVVQQCAYLSQRGQSCPQPATSGFLFCAMHSRAGVGDTEIVRVPTTKALQDVIAALAAGIPWQGSASGVVRGSLHQTECVFDLHNLSHWDNETAVRLLTDHGLEAAKLLIALMNLEDYAVTNKSGGAVVTVSLSTILRRAGCNPHPHGGFEREVRQRYARLLELLGNLHVSSSVTVYRDTSSKRKAEAMTERLGQVLVLDHPTSGAADLARARETISYQLGTGVRELVYGKHPQYTLASARLLGYGRYPFLLGLGLAFYDRVNRQWKRSAHQIHLHRLLTMVGLSIPTRNASRFLHHVEKALHALNQDGVIPGVRLRRGLGTNVRQTFKKAMVEFPARP